MSDRRDRGQTQSFITTDRVAALTSFGLACRAAAPEQECSGAAWEAGPPGRPRTSTLYRTLAAYDEAVATTADH
ncbi:hypothetical protein OHB49_41800 [Streptomyces sp. NBC_01717]|uniref:hypothetical protein n=1 Tax=Streptomyces sp. NBC_01717 TaxID=2975918 RepID=UPI002E34C4DC|nr:hypothetical protein [Streptomyces sp. NBC_01717]